MSNLNHETLRFIIPPTTAEPHECPCCGLWHANHGCIRGKVHGIVLTRDDDPEDYDERVLGPVPNGHQYGYCEDCKKAFKWSCSVYCWLPWSDAERHEYRIQLAAERLRAQDNLEEMLEP